MTTDVSFNFTPTAQGGKPGGKSAGGIAQSGLTGLGNGGLGNGLGGLNFMDLIFARLASGQPGDTPTDGDAATLTAQATQTKANTATITAETPETPDAFGMLVNDAPLSEEAEKFVNSLLTVMQGTDISIETAMGTTATSDAPTLLNLDGTARKKFLGLLNSLLQAVPAQNRAITLPDQASPKAHAALQVKSADISEKSGALVAAGLTIEDINAVIQAIKDGKDLSNDAAAQDILAAIVQFLPGQSANAGQQPVILPPRAGSMPKAPAQQSTANSGGDTAADPAMDTLAAKLNDLTVGGDEESTEFTTGDAVPDGEDGGSAGGKTRGFDQILRLLESAQNTAAKTAAADKTLPGAAQQAGAHSTLGAAFFDGLGSFLNGASLDSLFPEGFDWTRGTNGTGTMTVTGPALLASHVTNTANPASPHPTTQAVIATMTRGAQNGGDNTISMQLDPPDLGKLEISMRFSKDKTMKAHMVIEKPETLLMLQRDSQILERSLHDAGIDVSGGSLSFELADQSHDWGRDGDGHGYEGGNGARNGKDNADDNGEIVIESTMAWYTDANTGHQRYSILA